MCSFGSSPLKLVTLHICLCVLRSPSAISQEGRGTLGCSEKYVLINMCEEDEDLLAAHFLVGELAHFSSLWALTPGRTGKDSVIPTLPFSIFYDNLCLYLPSGWIA